MNAPTEAVPAPAKEVIDFAENELVGRLLNLVVVQLESLKTPWHLTSEVNQKVRISNMRSEITTGVIDAVKTIVTERVPAIDVSLGKVEFGADGIKATITMSRNAPGRHTLADKTGSTVFLQLAEPERFIGGGEKVHADPDQPKLNLPEHEADPDEERRSGDDRRVAQVALEEGRIDTRVATGDRRNAEEIPPVADDAATDKPLSSVPEIRPFKDGFMIYQDETPIAGAQKFATQDDAEKYLRDHLKIQTPAEQRRNRKRK